MTYTYNSSLRLPGCIIMILACCLANVFAQATEGSILGTVFDPAGLPAPNATVTVKGTNTGLTRAALTNEAGEYVVPALPLGTYSVTAQREGFREAVFPNIVITVQARVRADLTFEIGEISESVIVSDVAAPLLKTNTAEVEIVEQAISIDDLVARVRKTADPARPTLIVGHRGTVPRIVKALGGGDIPELRADEHNRLIVLTMLPAGKASIVTLRYGQ